MLQIAHIIQAMDDDIPHLRTPMFFMWDSPATNLPWLGMVKIPPSKIVIEMVYDWVFLRSFKDENWTWGMMRFEGITISRDEHHLINILMRSEKYLKSWDLNVWRSHPPNKWDSTMYRTRETWGLTHEDWWHQKVVAHVSQLAFSWMTIPVCGTQWHLTYPMWSMDVNGSKWSTSTVWK